MASIGDRVASIAKTLGSIAGLQAREAARYWYSGILSNRTILQGSQDEGRS